MARRAVRRPRLRRVRAGRDPRLESCGCAPRRAARGRWSSSAATTRRCPSSSAWRRPSRCARSSPGAGAALYRCGRHVTPWPRCARWAPTSRRSAGAQHRHAGARARDPPARPSGSHGPARSSGGCRSARAASSAARRTSRTPSGWPPSRRWSRSPAPAAPARRGWRSSWPAGARVAVVRAGAGRGRRRRASAIADGSATATAACWCSTTASTCSTARPPRRGPLLPLPRPPRPRHQPRPAGGRRRAGAAPRRPEPAGAVDLFVDARAGGRRDHRPHRRSASCAGGSTACRWRSSSRPAARARWRRRDRRAARRAVQPADGVGPPPAAATRRCAPRSPGRTTYWRAAAAAVRAAAGVRTRLHARRRRGRVRGDGVDARRVVGCSTSWSAPRCRRPGRGRTRYSLLETLREYGAERLAARGERKRSPSATPTTSPARSGDRSRLAGVRSCRSSTSSTSCAPPCAGASATSGLTGRSRSSRAVVARASGYAEETARWPRRRSSAGRRSTRCAAALGTASVARLVIGDVEAARRYAEAAIALEAVLGRPLAGSLHARADRVLRRRPAPRGGPLARLRPGSRAAGYHSLACEANGFTVQLLHADGRLDAAAALAAEMRGGRAAGVADGGRWSCYVSGVALLERDPAEARRWLEGRSRSRARPITTT